MLRSATSLLGGGGGGGCNTDFEGQIWSKFEIKDGQSYNSFAILQFLSFGPEAVLWSSMVAYRCHKKIHKIFIFFFYFYLFFFFFFIFLIFFFLF